MNLSSRLSRRTAKRTPKNSSDASTMITAYTNGKRPHSGSSKHSIACSHVNVLICSPISAYL